DIYAMGREELANIPTLPGSLDEALDALDADHDFMLKGDVFTQDLIDTWIEYKRENETDQLRLRPHPYELYMYYDV
ncbi:MAG TPA: glutamine synthetase, partial [Nitrospinaceae bacterium]|nr:glutamine synthetase [Nitrospinaceae bacterium]